MAKSSLGLKENIGGVLAYAFGAISGLLIYLLEKENKTIRFHALQSLIVFGGLWILSIVVSVIPIVGWLIAVLLTPVSFILWVYMMITAYQGKKVKLPIAGKIAEENA